MLTVRGDDVVTGGKQPGDSHIQRLGGVGGEDAAVRVIAVKEPRRLFPAAVNDAGGFQGAVMTAPSAVAQGAHGTDHSLDDALRLAQRRGGVVQIDHGSVPPLFVILK